MKKSRKVSKKWVALILALVVATSLMLGTFLWYTTTGSLTNVFDMDAMDVRLTEKFNPDVIVEPGATITKEVGVENTGNADVFVRMNLLESLQLLEMDGDNPKIDYRVDPALGADEIIVTVGDGQIATLLGSGFVDITPADAPDDVVVYKQETRRPDGTGTDIKYFAYLDDGTNRLMSYDPDETEKYTYAFYKKGAEFSGLHGIAAHGTAFPHHGTDAAPLIKLNLDTTDWVLDDTTGWYYYNQVLGPKGVTSNLVTSVEFGGAMGNKYKGAIYTLTPTFEAIQAKEGAVDDVWGANGFFEYDEATKKITIDGNLIP